MIKHGKQNALTLLFPMFYFVFSQNVFALPGEDYAESLVAAAFENELYNDRYWHTLLHYKTTVSGSISLIDDPDFFLSEDGRKNPKSELEETINAFFRPVEADKKHPVCRFAARFYWLKEKIPIDVSRLPAAQCQAFERMIEELKPVSASIIFPTYHMNNPASMFGHTLLTIETENQSKLLSYAINYAAVTDETFGPVYALKGLFGFYEGYFSILPYYTKLQEYSDMSDRDIWEYPLNLTREEIIRMLLHVYELDYIYSNYFFFDENCSYVLLFLLDAARPGLDLTSQCKWWVIPLDTIKLVKKNDLITDVNYRPSKTTRIAHLAGLIPETGHKVAVSIATGHIKPGELTNIQMDPAHKIRTADLAIELLQYRYAQKELSKEEYLSIFLPSLEMRSTLGDVDTDRPEIDKPTSPYLGHDANRLRLGLGYKDDAFFQEIRFRPANHGLLDEGSGYLEGAQIVFCDTAVRYYSSGKRIELNNIDLIDIISISPRDTFFKPVSWKISTGLTRKVMHDENDGMVAYLDYGGGVAYDFDLLGLCYAMVVADVDLGSDLRNGYAIGAGIKTGIVRDISDRLKCHLYVNDTEYFAGDRHNEFEGTVAANFSLKNNIAIGVEISRTIAHNVHYTEGCLYWNLFF